MTITLCEHISRNLAARLCAKNPIEPDVFAHIPFFEEVFEKELWPLLVKLAGGDGIAHIERKHFPPGARLIRKGEFDMMVFWLIEGCAEVVADINGSPVILKKYDKPGQCFGEVAIIDEGERTADVVACRNGGAVVLEVDWSVTMLARELEGRFTKLLLKTVNRKLMDSYEITKKAFMALQKVKADAEKQNAEMARLRSLIEANGVASEDEGEIVTTEIEEIAGQLDKGIKNI